MDLYVYRIGRELGSLAAALGGLAGQALGTQVNQHHVAFCAARHNTQATLNQGFSQSLGIQHHLLLVFLECGLQGFVESHSFACNHVHQGATLNAGENCAVDLLGQFFFHQNDATAWAAQPTLGQAKPAGIPQADRHAQVDALFGPWNGTATPGCAVTAKFLP